MVIFAHSSARVWGGLGSTEIITFACRSCPDKGKAPADVSPLATHRRASLYLGGVWIRQPKELEMKRLLDARITKDDQGQVIHARGWCISKV